MLIPGVWGLAVIVGLREFGKFRSGILNLFPPEVRMTLLECFGLSKDQAEPDRPEDGPRSRGQSLQTEEPGAGPQTSETK